MSALMVIIGYAYISNQASMCTVCVAFIISTAKHAIKFDYMFTPMRTHLSM